MWALISGWGASPHTLVWDRESGIGGSGKLTEEAAGFAGTLGVRIKLAPARDPEYKGLTERRNGYFETSFLPGRVFTSPGDFNTQIGAWIAGKANARHLRSIGTSPAARWPGDLAAMVALPPFAPSTGVRNRVRLARDYYVRIDGNDYSVDPRMIGRFVDVVATLEHVIATCGEKVVATHARYWGTAATVTDPEHVAIAKQLRTRFRAIGAERSAAARQARGTRTHGDGHVVAIRALPDYDALFGVDFHHQLDEPDEGAQTS